MQHNDALHAAAEIKRLVAELKIHYESWQYQLRQAKTFSDIAAIEAQIDEYLQENYFSSFDDLLLFIIAATNDYNYDIENVQLPLIEIINWKTQLENYIESSKEDVRRILSIGIILANEELLQVASYSPIRLFLDGQLVFGINGFQVVAVEQHPADWYKQVIAALDHRTTETCKLAHHQIVRLDDKFHLTGQPRYSDYMEHPPFHNWCRSVVRLLAGERLEYAQSGR